MFAEFTSSEMLANMDPSWTLDELYPAVAIRSLMRIIRDPSLSQHHTMVVQAITFIFKSLGLKCIPYVEEVIPAYLSVIRSTNPKFREVCKIYSCLQGFLLNNWRANCQNLNKKIYHLICLSSLLSVT